MRQRFPLQFISPPSPTSPLTLREFNASFQDCGSRRPPFAPFRSAQRVWRERGSKRAQGGVKRLSAVRHEPVDDPGSEGPHDLAASPELSATVSDPEQACGTRRRGTGNRAVCPPCACAGVRVRRLISVDLVHNVLSALSSLQARCNG